MKTFAIVSLALVAMGLTACHRDNPEVTLPAVSQTAPQTTQGAINAAAITTAQTVASLANLPDDSRVTLTGKLVRALRDEKYEFADNTGTVVVEIDDELWGGRAVGANDTLTITGELDKSVNPLEKTKIDVDFVEFH